MWKPCFAIPLIVTIVIAGVSCRAQSTDDPAASSAAEATNSSGDWPGFRGPSGQGIAANTELPLHWDTTNNLAWQVPLPGPGASSPITLGDHIYLTCYSGYLGAGRGGNIHSLTRHLVALDRASGHTVWDQKVPAKMPEEETIRDHGYAANTPAADAQRLYAFLGKSGVHAFDHQGQPLWHADVGSQTHGWGTAASPLLYENLVIINASVESGSLVALDRASGRQRWRTEGINEAWNTPIVVTAPSGRKELIVARHGAVLSLRSEHGKATVDLRYGHPLVYGSHGSKRQRSRIFSWRTFRNRSPGRANRRRGQCHGYSSAVDQQDRFQRHVPDLPR